MSDIKDYIATHSGLKFHFLDPQHEEILIQDIAIGLARCPRWNGHTREVVTVAQHSVLVARMLQTNGYSSDIQMQGLLHDASEAYLGDLASPLKAHCPGFHAIELVVQAAILQYFFLPSTLHSAVKLMDTESYRWEYRDLMMGEDCEEPAGPRPRFQVWSEEESYYAFLEAFDTLMDVL
jgi:5'-deoxynucleotidase YfbR-like HD superfamily hydrolase